MGFAPFTPSFNTAQSLTSSGATQVFALNDSVTTTFDAVANQIRVMNIDATNGVLFRLQETAVVVALTATNAAFLDAKSAEVFSRAPGAHKFIAILGAAGSPIVKIVLGGGQ